MNKIYIYIFQIKILFSLQNIFFYIYKNIFKTKKRVLHIDKFQIENYDRCSSSWIFSDQYSII